MLFNNYTPVSNGILDTIGQTPLVRLHRCLSDSSIELYGKLEYFNPGGSAKDRPAARMIECALRQGVIDQKTTVIESTSGNMGIGLAQACRYHGLKLICVVDPHALPQNTRIMQAYGAELVCVDNRDNPQDSLLTLRLRKVRELLETIPDSFWPNQYENKENPQAHFWGTIQEIEASVQEELDYLFVATSSTGTAQGCRDYLRTIGWETKVVAVDAVGSVLFGGESRPRHIPGLGAGQVPPLAAGQNFDEVIRVSDLESVWGCRHLAATEAILVGGSGGAVVHAMGQMRPELRGKQVAAIFHDSGTRYMDTVYNDAWVREELKGNPEDLPAPQMLTPADPLEEMASNPERELVC